MRRFGFVGVLVWGMLSVACAGGGRMQAERIAVDLVLSPPDAGTNRLQTTLTVYAMGTSARDTDTATVTGTMQANLGVFIDDATYEVADVNSLEFTGGAIRLSDMSFTLNYGFLLGRIEARATGIGGAPSSPWGPGAVEAERFDTADHLVLLNEGSVAAWGTGLMGALFEPVTLLFADAPIEARADAVGTVAVRLERIDADEVIYRVDLMLPVAYDELSPINESVTAAITGGGVIAATGTFSLPRRCRFRADLTGDCRVDLYDLMAFCDQWLTAAEEDPCPLSADLAGADCYVDLDDFAVLAEEWLGSDPAEGAHWGQ
ncbi:MAG: hypothetical protein IH624_08535 [Phycisphaerae bacterium]|nr:hypothetical protein [Phycisphaerae bacterium]